MVMAKYDSIKDIKKGKDAWRIQGRIVYSWDFEYSSDFIIMDSEGNNIQASIPKKLKWKYKSLIQDGEVRFLGNFTVTENSGIYQTTNHACKITFKASTTFEPATNAIIPNCPLKFASFSDINMGKLDENVLIDVIGILNGESEIEIPKAKRLIRIELRNNENESLICTLWENYADQMASFIDKIREDGKPHVIIIRLAKIKTFRDSKISNSLCSKILMDAELPEVRDFLKRRIDGAAGLSSVTLTRLTSHSENVANEFLDFASRRTINEIQFVQEDSYLIVLATITGIDTEYSWFSESCKTCRGRVELDEKGRWLCMGKCEDYAKAVVLRYKVRTIVKDHTGSSIFILYDTPATALLDQSAKELREKQIKDGDTSSYPTELDVLVGRKFIFKIKYTTYHNITLKWTSYGVNKLTENPELIEQFNEGIKTLKGDLYDLDSRDETTLSTGGIKEGAAEVDSHEEHTVQPNDQRKESVESTYQDESETSSINITPSKRTLETCIDDAQLSTTKRQVGTTVKNEK